MPTRAILPSSLQLLPQCLRNVERLLIAKISRIVLVIFVGDIDDDESPNQLRALLPLEKAQDQVDDK